MSRAVPCEVCGCDVCKAFLAISSVLLFCVPVTLTTCDWNSVNEYQTFFQFEVTKHIPSRHTICTIIMVDYRYALFSSQF